MRAALFGLLWLLPGVWLALRGRTRPAAERVLILVFWPFFLGAEGPVEAAPPSWTCPEGPLGRLHQALGGDHAATGVVVELQRAVARLEDRLSRLDAALGQLASGEQGEVSEALRAARSRSADLLEHARARCRGELDAALAAVEETATRLVIARETGSSTEVRGLLDSLRSRLHAAEEVASMGPEVGEQELRVVG